MTDIINTLADISDDLARVRAQRSDAVTNAQRSFSALLEPDEPGEFTFAQRYAIAAFVAGISHDDEAAEFYQDLLADTAEPALTSAVTAAIASGTATGPQVDAGFTLFSGPAELSALGPKLAAAFDFAHVLTFHPKDASPELIGHLDEAGWSADEIVTLAQLVSFEAFQLRVAHGLRVLDGAVPAAAENTTGSQHEAALAPTVADPGWAVTKAVRVPGTVRPTKFVNHSLGWQPWVAPLEKSEFSDAQRDALIQPQRIDSPYFRLLARDSAALKARTLTDLDIFYNTDGGMGRAERELAATVVSRLNGCEFCASVHQARSHEEGGDRAALDRLLDHGVEADLGTHWNLIRDAAVALTRTPFSFGPEHVAALKSAGYDDLGVIDAINASAFFNWANRLMLTLGEAELPKRFQ